MPLVSHSFNKYTHSFASTNKKHGHHFFYRFTEEQLQFFEDYPEALEMSRCQAGVFLTFKTSGDKIRFMCKTNSAFHRLKFRRKEIYPNDAFAIYVDHKLVATPLPKTGKITVSFNNSLCKEVTVRIQFPFSTKVGIADLITNGSLNPVSSEKKKMMYMFGDGRMQGEGVERSYASMTATQLGIDALNQGIAGFEYDAELLEGLKNLPQPDYVLINFAFSNDENSDRDTRLFFQKLHSLYQHVPTFVVVTDDEKKVIKECRRYEYSMIPLQAQMYSADDEGHDALASMLVKKLRELI